MTPPTTTTSNAPASPLPTATQLLANISWHELEHANPFDDFDLATSLANLLHPDTAARTAALRELQEAVHHQNTIYTSTPPVVTYIAALLVDPRSEPVEVEVRDQDHPWPLRAALLNWIAAIAEDASDDAIAAGQRRGIAMSAEQAEIRALRPTLLEAATIFTSSPDIHIRHAATTAALRLLDTDDELRRYQPQYTVLVEEILERSTYWYHRGVALDALTAWGHDTTAQWQTEMARRQAGAAARWADAGLAIAFSTEPPF